MCHFLISFKAILNKCGQTLPDEAIAEMIDVADADKDGRIDYRGNLIIYSCVVHNSSNKHHFRRVLFKLAMTL